MIIGLPTPRFREEAEQLARNVLQGHMRNISEIRGFRNISSALMVTWKSGDTLWAFLKAQKGEVMHEGARYWVTVSKSIDERKLASGLGCARSAFVAMVAASTVPATRITIEWGLKSVFLGFDKVVSYDPDTDEYNVAETALATRGIAKSSADIVALIRAAKFAR
jgi:hypothetical protein